LKPVKIALEPGVFKDYSFEDSLRYASEIGYKSVEIASRRIYSRFEADRASESEVLKAKDLLSEFNLKQCAVFTTEIIRLPPRRQRQENRPSRKCGE
jgi:sugar phosphate isomerase/epimerase